MPPVRVGVWVAVALPLGVAVGVPDGVGVAEGDGLGEVVVEGEGEGVGDGGVGVGVVDGVVDGLLVALGDVELELGLADGDDVVGLALGEPLLFVVLDPVGAGELLEPGPGVPVGGLLGVGVEPLLGLPRYAAGEISGIAAAIRLW